MTAADIGDGDPFNHEEEALFCRALQARMRLCRDHEAVKRYRLLLAALDSDPEGDELPPKAQVAVVTIAALDEDVVHGVMQLFNLRWAAGFIRGGEGVEWKAAQ